jgi:hypothetical protein
MEITLRVASDAEKNDAIVALKSDNAASELHTSTPRTRIRNTPRTGNDEPLVTVL